MAALTSYDEQQQSPIDSTRLIRPADLWISIGISRLVFWLTSWDTVSRMTSGLNGTSTYQFSALLSYSMLYTIVYVPTFILLSIVPFVLVKMPFYYHEVPIRKCYVNIIQINDIAPIFICSCGFE
jgi:hypothetical protein